MTGGNGVGTAARTRTAAPDVQLPAPCEHHHEKKRNRTVNANNLTDGMSQQERTTFKVGDRVRVVKSDGPLKDRLEGKTGEVFATERDWVYVNLDTPVYTKAGYANYEGHWALADELEAAQQ